MSSLTYFISWTCYGNWPRGDARGSVDREHNVVGEAWLEPEPDLESLASGLMTQPPYEMDQTRRKIVRDTIINVCAHRKWTLHALHVRKYHVHVVVTADHSPERVMNDFKSYASRALNEAGLDNSDRRRWTRHGSTKYINDNAYLQAAINYTLNKQGEPMERWPDSSLPHGRVS